MQSIRQAARNLRRSPGFTLLAVVTLGLAIGVCTGLYNVIDTVLLDPLPYEDADRLVSIAASAPGSDMPPEFGVSGEFFIQYQESDLITHLATLNSFTSTLRDGDRAERLGMSAPTASLFETLGVTPLLGRLPVAEDEEGVVLLSHSLWQSWFGGDSAVLGRELYVSGEERTVIGVMPEDFWFPHDGVEAWFPNVIESEEIEPGRFGGRLVARLAPGVSPEELSAELDRLASRLPERFGGSAAYAQIIEKHRSVVRPLETEIFGDVSQALWILFGSMGIVLVIACANVAGLLTVRAENRQADLAVRRALGAPRGRLIGSQLVESLWIAGLSGILAVALARLGVPLLLRFAPVEVPRLGSVTLTPGTVLFAFSAAVLAALCCGLVPAVRFSAPSLWRLRQGTRGSTRRRRLGSHALPVIQTALALVLLIASALLLHSFERLRGVDPGYDTADVFTFQFAPEGEHLQDAASFARLHTDFMDRLRAVPGVETVGLVDNIPLNEGLATTRFQTRDLDPGGGTLLSLTWAAGDYFPAMGIEVLRGRAFTEADHTTELGNVLVSRSAAELLWPGEDPIGRKLRPEGGEETPEPWETVVGVVDDVRQYGFRRPAEPMVYLPLVGQDPENSRWISSPAYVLKTPRASEIAPEIRALVREIAPGAPMYRTYTLAELASDSMARLSFTLLALGIAAGLALILGLVGLYGVLSYAVAARSREIGVRMALGAEASTVQGMIVAQGARVLAFGAVLGCLGAAGAAHALDELLFETAPFDPPTYLAVTALTVLVGLSASWIPARRASRVDPMESLRAE